MAKKLPFSATQNPAPNPATSGQDYLNRKQSLVLEIMASFRKVLPSNYVARTNGPWYSLQFQAMAEQLAEVQILSAEVSKDSQWDFTRTDFLWQTLGTMVFPDLRDNTFPQVEDDIAYREFLRTMVQLLLQGATKKSLESGLEALDSSIVATVVERYLDTAPRNKQGAYSIEDQFTIDIFVEGSEPNTFPDNPLVTQENAALVLRALKPAHVLYSYSYLFREIFTQVLSDEDGLSIDWDSYYYDDLRRYQLGSQRISGSTGETLSDRTLFSDPSVSFGSIIEGARLRISEGVNQGSYRVIATRALLYGASPGLVSYTLSTGGSGSLTCLSPDTVEDALRDWGVLAPDTLVSITSGPNLGTYRLDTVLGNTGGPLGTVGISGTQIRLAPCIIKVDRRMPQVLSGQSYTVEVDRLGVQVPRVITGEDLSSQCYL